MLRTFSRPDSYRRLRLVPDQPLARLAGSTSLFYKLALTADREFHPAPKVVLLTRIIGALIKLSSKEPLVQQFSIWRSLPRIFRTIAEKLGQEAPKLQKLTAKLNFLLADGPYLELLPLVKALLYLQSLKRTAHRVVIAMRSCAKRITPEKVFSPMAPLTNHPVRTWRNLSL
jgi:hypothetical protein